MELVMDGNRARIGFVSGDKLAALALWLTIRSLLIERSIFGHQFAIGLKSRDFFADRFLPAGVPNLGVNSLLGGFGCQQCLGICDLQCLGSRYFAFEPKNEIGSSRGVVRSPKDLVLVLFKGLDPGANICSVIGRITRNANFGGNKDACQFGPQFFLCVIQVAKPVQCASSWSAVP